MNKLMTVTLASLFSIAMVPAAVAQVASDGNTPNWQSMSPTDLLLAAKNLTGNDPAVKAGRQSLAGNVAVRFLADPAATRTLSFSQWGEFVKLLSADLTADQRGQWAGKIRAAYVQDATGLAAVKTNTDVRSLISILSKLGDPQAGNVAGAFTLSTTAWQSWKPAQLVDLGRRLSILGTSGADARRAVAGMVTSKYLSPESAKSFNLGQWKDLTKSLGADLSAEAKAQWSTGIANAFAGSGGTAVLLSATDTQLLKMILTQLGTKDLAVDLIVKLANDPNAMQPMSSKDLGWALKDLTGDTPAIKAARRKIADLLTTKFLADANSARSASPGQWNELSTELSADLTAEQKAQWIAKLRGAFVQDPAGLASLKTGMELEFLTKALGKLGDKQDDVNGIAAMFVKGTTLWQSWPPAGVVALAGRIEKLDTGAQARQAIMAFATARYTSAESAKSLTLSDWRHLSGYLRRDLSAEAKAQWASVVVQAYAGSDEAIGVLDPNNSGWLVGALGNLDAGDKAVDTLASLVTGSTGWQTWDLDSRIWLIGVLASPDKREATKPARLRILEHITATCMPTNEEARKVPLKQWASLVMGLYDVMPEETSTLWAERLRGVFDSATLASLGADVKQRRALLPIVAILDEKMKTGLALNWLKDKTLWQGAPIEVLTALAVSAYSTNRDETLPLLVDLDKYCVTRHATQPLTLDECLALRGMYVKVGQLPKAQQWVLVGCDMTIGTEALRAAADQATVVKLSLALVDTGLVGPEKDTTKLAATVAAVAAKGGLTLSAAWQPRCLSEALCTAESRQIVRDGLLDSAGNPWPFISDTLSWAYASSGKFKEWATYLDDQIARAPDGSDKKLLWQIARAHAEAARFQTYSALAGRKWLDDALASAKEPRQRFMVVEELASGYMATGNYDKGIGSLKDLAESFAGTEFAPAIVKLQAGLQGAREKDQLAKTRAAAEARRMHMEELQRRLAEAKAKKDAEAIQRLQRLLGVEEQ